MEIKYIMIEAEKNNDYPISLEKLKEMEKIVADFSLNEEIRIYKEDCQNTTANKEKMEIKKLLEKQEFDGAIKQFQKLLNNKIYLVLPIKNT